MIMLCRTAFNFLNVRDVANPVAFNIFNEKLWKQICMCLSKKLDDTFFSNCYKNIILSLMREKKGIAKGWRPLEASPEDEQDEIPELEKVQKCRNADLKRHKRSSKLRWFHSSKSATLSHFTWFSSSIKL
jgi:hypothetical protein